MGSDPWLDMIRKSTDAQRMRDVQRMLEESRVQVLEECRAQVLDEQQRHAACRAQADAQMQLANRPSKKIGDAKFLGKQMANKKHNTFLYMVRFYGYDLIGNLLMGASTTLKRIRNWCDVRRGPWWDKGLSLRYKSQYYASVYYGEIDKAKTLKTNYENITGKKLKVSKRWQI